jgi:S1-C subfamily serine protease
VDPHVTDPAPTTATSASTPPPPPPADVRGQAPGRQPSRRWPLVGGAVLVLAAVAGGSGAMGAVIATRNTASNSPSSGAPTVSVDSRSLPPEAQGTAAAVSAKLNPSVGTIVVATQGGGGLGSGFVVSNSGGTSYLLTNNHVVTGATTLHVIMPNDRTYAATVVGTDTFDDLAVVSVNDGHLPAATFGDSTALVTGQLVIAIGSPLGNVGSVTTGVISALHRTIQAGDQATGSQETLQDVLQTDASINPGNSGGPLADTAGRVVGVNVAASGSASNIGFSIPSRIAQRVTTALIKHQPISIPYMGVAYSDPLQAAQNGTPYSEPGLKVTTVQAGGPAAAAGIRVGDVLISVDGRSFASGLTLGGVIQSHSVGDTLTVVVSRGGQQLSVKLTLAARPTTGG